MSGCDRKDQECLKQHASAYAHLFVNGHPQTVCDQLACIDNHTMAEAIAITAWIMYYLPPETRLEFISRLETQAEE